MTSASAALLTFDNRADWLKGVNGGSPDLSENFDGVGSDQVYHTNDLSVGFLTFGTIGDSTNPRFRIDVPNNAYTDFDVVRPDPSLPETTFAILTFYGGTSSEMSFVDTPLRAIGFDFRIGDPVNRQGGSLVTSLGDEIPVDEAGSFIGIFYDAGEQFTSLTLSSLGNFGLSIDNVEAFRAPLTSLDSALKAPNPVPLPAAFWLFASALAGLFGFGRRSLDVSS